MGRKRKTGTPDATMQLDAVVDDLEEIAAPDLMQVHAMSAPPPLPPKKAGASAWLVGGAVVVIAAAAAVGIGLGLRSMRPGPAPTPAAASEPAPAAPEPAPEVVAEEPAEEPTEAAGPTVQMEEFVFDDEEPAAEEAPTPSE